jgi:hypothetical protein
MLRPADIRTDWVMYSEYTFTRNDYLRTVSVIHLEWVFEASPTYFNPRLFADSDVKTKLFRMRCRLKQPEPDA